MSKKIIIGAVVVAAMVGGLLFYRLSGNRQEPDVTPAPFTGPTQSPTLSPTLQASNTLLPSPTSTHSPSPKPTLSPTSNPTPTPTSSPTPTPTTTTTTTPSPTLPPGPQTYDIRIQDFSYYPGTLNVKKGDIVRFTNYDSVKHNAVADGGQWATPLLSQGESATLDTSNLALGTYRYHCSIHPQMVGTLRILE